MEKLAETGEEFHMDTMDWPSLGTTTEHQPIVRSRSVYSLVKSANQLSSSHLPPPTPTPSVQKESKPVRNGSQFDDRGYDLENERNKTGVQDDCHSHFHPHHQHQQQRKKKHQQVKSRSSSDGTVLTGSSSCCGVERKVTNSTSSANRIHRMTATPPNAWQANKTRENIINQAKGTPSATSLAASASRDAVQTPLSVATKQPQEKQQRQLQQGGGKEEEKILLLNQNDEIVLVSSTEEDGIGSSPGQRLRRRMSTGRIRSASADFIRLLVPPAVPWHQIKHVSNGTGETKRKTKKNHTIKKTIANSLESSDSLLSTIPTTFVKKNDVLRHHQNEKQEQRMQQEEKYWKKSRSMSFPNDVSSQSTSAASCLSSAGSGRTDCNDSITKSISISTQKDKNHVVNFPTEPVPLQKKLSTSLPIHQTDLSMKEEIERKNHIDVPPIKSATSLSDANQSGSYDMMEEDCILDVYYAAENERLHYSIRKQEEEARALSWSVTRAVQQGVITNELGESLCNLLNSNAQAVHEMSSNSLNSSSRNSICSSNSNSNKVEENNEEMIEHMKEFEELEARESGNFLQSPPRLDEDEQRKKRLHERANQLVEVRDVLFHKCHLQPVVQSLTFTPFSSISLSNPAAESRANQMFQAVLEKEAAIELRQEKHYKLAVLHQISQIMINWVNSTLFLYNSKEDKTFGGSVFVGGSYRLGLNDPNADIDAICVVPYHITKNDFFASFYQVLQDTKNITELYCIPNAFVPIISIVFHGVKMDLLFARLPQSTVEIYQEIDCDYILAGVDVASMKSLNVARVSTLLLALVPDRRQFRIVLRAIRLWAQRRGIYSSKLGYLGGVSWAILTAFVCQLYPKSHPATIFTGFFTVLAEWNWPQPILVNRIYDAGLGFDIWDPVHNLYDRAHLMPIITPAYPNMNSSVQVNASTFHIMKEEIWRARSLTEMAVLQFATHKNESSDTQLEDAKCWESLFLPSNFFVRYGHYFVIDFAAATSDEMMTWGKFVQSRLRKLVECLQHVACIMKIHPFPSRFHQTSSCLETPNHNGASVFFGLEFHPHASSTTTSATSTSTSNAVGLDMSKAGSVDRSYLESLNAAIRFFLATDLCQFANRSDGMTANIRLLEWQHLPHYVFPDYERNKKHILESHKEIMKMQHFQQQQSMNSSNPRHKQRQYMGPPTSTRSTSLCSVYPPHTQSQHNFQSNSSYRSTYKKNRQHFNHNNSTSPPSISSTSQFASNSNSGHRVYNNTKKNRSNRGRVQTTATTTTEK